MFPELFPKYNSDMRQQAILQWQGPKGRVPEDEKDSKVEGRKDKSWGWRVAFAKAMFMPRKLLKTNTVLYTAYSGKRKETEKF